MRKSMKKIRLVQKFGGNTALESVSFVGGWMCFFFAHFAELTVYPSYARSSLAPLGKIQIVSVKDINTSWNMDIEIKLQSRQTYWIEYLSGEG